jgi:hypothetical protein
MSRTDDLNLDGLPMLKSILSQAHGGDSHSASVFAELRQLVERYVVAYLRLAAEHEARDIDRWQDERVFLLRELDRERAAHAETRTKLARKQEAIERKKLEYRELQEAFNECYAEGLQTAKERDEARRTVCHLELDLEIGGIDPSVSDQWLREEADRRWPGTGDELFPEDGL